MSTIQLVVPCYNEEEGIGKVLGSIPYDTLDRQGFDIDVLVVDNNSTDKTAEIVRRYPVRLISEKRQGKGYALITGFRNISRHADIIVMIDGDDTYKIKELPRLVEPISSGFCDVVVGSRLHGKMSCNSMSYFNRIGNWFFTFLSRFGYRVNSTDVCSGYFAWKREVVEAITPYLTSNGFAIEMEMIVKMARMGFQIYSVPITYEERSGHSHLQPLTDGYRIFSTWLRHLTWQPAMRKPKKFPNVHETTE